MAQADWTYAPIACTINPHFAPLGRRGFPMMISTSVAVPMSNAARRAVLIMAMFFWDFVTAQLTKYDANVVSATRALGANMGLYNGFLAAGLAWSLRAPPDHNTRLALFFVGCVLAAGVFGFSVSWKLLIVQ